MMLDILSIGFAKTPGISILSSKAWSRRRNHRPRVNQPRVSQSLAGCTLPMRHAGNPTIHAIAGSLLHRVQNPSCLAENANIAALLTALSVATDDLETSSTSKPQGLANACERSQPTSIKTGQMRLATSRTR